MNLRSELIHLQIVDDKGERKEYYTYDGYFETEDRLKLRSYRRNA
jgi:hypothetical protein